jgi:serine/threonine-protein kinase
VSEPLVGAIVDTRYELRRLIAHGGMGLVFEAHHRFTRRMVALKLLPEALRPKREARGRLLREAHALETIRHPGIVEVLDAGVCADNGPYVVLEMLEGRTLDGILAARRRLSIADAVQVGRQVCDAVAHAHARGVVHRDLKPSNIFVARSETRHEVVKLIDLGVAAMDEEQLAQLDRKLTTAREVLGTPEYMAPEQLWGREVDARTDVYAIGMSLLECLTGEVPYGGEYPDVLVQVSNSPAPPDVRSRRGDVSPTLAMVVEHALEKEPGARFQTALELGRALAAAAGLPAGSSALLSAPTPEAPESDPGPETVRGHDGSSLAPPGRVEEQAIKLVRRKSRRPDSLGSSSAPPPSHRRQFARAPYTTPVFLVPAGGLPVEARSEEISEEGMLVLSPVPFALGAPVTLRFASPLTGEILVVPASIRWTREGRGKTALGVEFDSVSGRLRAALVTYVGSFASDPER